MGVRNLRRLLEPHADRIDCNGQKVVIDGPSLAYHIFYLCIRNQNPAGLFEQPSYSQLGETAIAWLDQLCACGVTV
jgi:hypothetical protein